MNERITARVVLVNDEHKVLLLKMHFDGMSYWLTPGGKIDEGETPLEAAQRELFEETGINNVTLTNPHTWYLEHIGMCHGVETLFKEHIFLAYTQETKVNFDNHIDYERNAITSYAWWDIDEFKNKQEIVRPQGFIDELALITSFDIKSPQRKPIFIQ